MITITKEMRTETAHRLIDYDGRCAHLHGHSYRWVVTAGNAVLTPNGMVADFKHLKAAMIRVLDPFDHALVLHKDDPYVLSFNSNVLLRQSLQATNGEEPRLILFDWNPTAENFAQYAFEEIRTVIWQDPDIPAMEIVSVKVWETATSFAEYKG